MKFLPLQSEALSVSRIRNFLRWRFAKPLLPRVHSGYILTFLGSQYGGKLFFDDKFNDQSIIICAGAGLDISFELEFQVKYRCMVVILDPTPQAISYFEDLKSASIGQTLTYVAGSQQPKECYPLDQVDFSSIVYIPCALWRSDEILSFFEGTHPKDISHSINSLHHNYKKSTKSFEVKGISLQTVLRERDIKRVELLKLDVEGSALEILSTLKREFAPRQIIMEFDEAHYPGVKSFFRVLKIRWILKRLGYVAVGQNQFDFTYLRKH